MAKDSKPTTSSSETHLRRERVLLPEGRVSAEQILTLYKRLTGREATPQECQDVEKLLEESLHRR